MNILITGGLGFVGKKISDFLINESHTITSLGIEKENDITIDLSKQIPTFLKKTDLVIHAAGKAHIIPIDEVEKKSFFDINFQGTKNLCIGLENNNLPKSLIFISSVAVYGVEDGENIDEMHPLDGKTPYALSKIMAEMFLQEWCLKNNVILGILRPSLIAGPTPPGNLGTMVNGIKTGKYFRIGKGTAKKSIVMAEDIGNIVSKLAEIGGIYNICDNHHPTFAELELIISKQLNKKPPKSIPFLGAKILALLGDLLWENFPINSNKLSKITKSLTFSNEKAKSVLSWKPIDVLENFKII